MRPSNGPSRPSKVNSIALQRRRPLREEFTVTPDQDVRGGLRQRLHVKGREIPRSLRPLPERRHVRTGEFVLAGTSAGDLVHAGLAGEATTTWEGRDGYRVLELVLAVLADVDLGIPWPFSAPLTTSARINAATMSSTTMAIPIGVRHLVAHFIGRIQSAKTLR